MKSDKDIKELFSLLLKKDRERCEASVRHKSSLKSLQLSHDARVRELTQMVADRDTQIALLRASTSYKLGNAVVRLARGARRSAVSVGRLRTPWARSRRSPENIRAAYLAATGPSQPFETVRSRSAMPFPAPGESEDAASLWQTLQSRREHGPRILDDLERSLLESFVDARAEPGSGDEALVRLLRAVLHEPGPSASNGSPSGPTGGGRLLIDARTLQGGRFDGTAKHGATILHSLLERRDRWHGVTLLIDDEREPVPARMAPGVKQTGFDKVTAGLISGTTAFLQLQPFHDLRYGEIVDDLLAAPWVRTATVWLDAIAGSHPGHFLTNPPAFFSYQWFVERLGRYDHVLALSAASRSEALPLVAEPDRVVVTGCRNPLKAHMHLAPDRSDLASGEPRVALFGNALPHKNVAAGLLAFAHAYFRHDGRLRLDVVANLGDGQVAGARAMLASLDDALPSAVIFHRRLPDVRLAMILACCRASIVPSFHEGFSLPVLESFAFGVPVVASDIPAHRELLGPDYPLAAPDDPVALGQALLRALDDPAPLVSLLDDAPVSRSEAEFASAMASFVDRFSQSGRSGV